MASPREDRFVVSPRVGISTTLPGSQFEARRNKLNSQIASQQDLNDQTIALRKQGKLSDSDWADFMAWLPEWNSFVSRWGKFQTDTAMNWVTGPDESALRDLEQKCFSLRQQYEALGGVVKSSVPIDKPYQPEPSAFDWAKLLAGIATVGVVGLGIYYGGKVLLAYRRTPAPEPLPAAGRVAGALMPHEGELEPHAAFAPPEGYVRTP